jgi:methyl-accepting chemotaxis protein
MRRFNDIRLLPKLMALFLLVGIVPLATIAFIARGQASSSLDQEARAKVAELAFNASDKLDRNLFERYGDVQAFALSQPAKSMNPEGLNDWMNKMMGIYAPIYTLMVVADPSGKIIAVNSVDLEGKQLDTSALLGRDVRDEEWFKAATGNTLKPNQTFVEDLHDDSLMATVFGAGEKARAMSFTFPIRDDDGKLVGVWTNRFNWAVTYDVLTAVLERAHESGMTTAELMIVSREGTVLASENPAEVLSRNVAAEDVVRSALAQGASGAESGAGLDGTDRGSLYGYFNSSGFGTYPGLGWGVIAGQSQSEALADVGALTTRILMVGAMAALVVAVVAVWVAITLRRPVAAVVERLAAQAESLGRVQTAMAALAAGDLTVSVTPDPEKIPNPARDEIGQAAASVNEIVDAIGRTVGEYNAAREQLIELIGQVKENSDSILNAAVQLGDSSDQMASATGQIATAINEVTRSAVSLSGLSQESAREVERVAAGSQQVAAGAATSADSAAQSRQEALEMGERIQVVATASQEVAKAADESRTAAQQGQQAVGQAVSSMESIATAVQRASRTVDQLGEYGQQIGDIVKAIDEIAAQTNLLALNAAIEAARAGEQGRGFAVVAENVRSLAERSSESTKEIADLIAKVQSGTQEAVEAMAVGVRDVQQGQQITEEAGRALTSIIGTVEQSASRMQEIARDVQGLASGAERIITSAEGIASQARESAAGAGEMAAGTTRVTEAIIQVSATSEETSASAEQVSASTEELSAQSEELAATANQMRDMAEALQKAAARFRLA